MSYLLDLHNRFKAAVAAGAEVPVPTRLDPASSDVGCIRYLKLSDPGLSRLAYIPVNAEKDFKPPPALVALCNELRGESRPTNLPQAVEYLARVAKFTFEHHGNHVPMLFLFNERWEQIDFLTAHFADQTDKYIFWRTVADRAAYLRAFGLVWISESWIRDAKEEELVSTRNLPIIGERLHVLGTDITKARHIVAWDIRRSDSSRGPTLESVPEDDPLESGGEIYFLEPVWHAIAGSEI